jgi:predicted MPP superfamily phosphohydrolase
MRVTIVLVIFIIFASLIDLYFYKSLKSVFSVKITGSLVYNISFFSISSITVFLLLFAFFKYDLPSNPYSVNYFYLFAGFFILFYIPKLQVLVFHLLEDIESIFFIRYKIITQIGFYSAIIIFLLILHGIFINKYNFKLREQVVYYDNLPSEFDGYSIIQISDLHIGSFHNNVDQIDKIVKIINDENPDLVVFTGDMVSNVAGEIDEFSPSLKNIKSKDGLISILGNHDYGEYVQWENEEQKQANLLSLAEKEKSVGFTLLENENLRITRNNSSIVIAGVENWGKPPFAQLGDINKALEGTNDSDFVVLLSHDPSHWRGEVLDKPMIDLTLSGHTHAMQFGFEFGSWQWSPIVLKYKEWGGLYSENNQYLYVNRGTGFIGFPGRIGIRPEISKIVLKKK